MEFWVFHRRLNKQRLPQNHLCIKSAIKAKDLISLKAALVKHTEDPGKKKKINPEQIRMRLELQVAEQAALTQRLMHEDVLKTWQKKT